MDKKIKAKWVKALRSGKYKQGTGVLFNGEKHCCLGVLCVVLGMKPRQTEISKTTGFDEWSFGRGSVAFLPPTAVRKSKITDDSGALPSGGSLLALNDAGTSFERIAEIIEREL